MYEPKQGTCAKVLESDRVGLLAGEAAADDWIVDRYAAMSDALNKTGRPMLFAIVGWGVGDPWKGWGAKVCSQLMDILQATCCSSDRKKRLPGVVVLLGTRVFTNI